MELRRHSQTRTGRWQLNALWLGLLGCSDQNFEGVGDSPSLTDGGGNSDAAPAAQACSAWDTPELLWSREFLDRGIGGPAVASGVVAVAVERGGFELLSGVDGGRRSFVASAPGALASDQNRPALGDVDGDGDDELVALVEGACVGRNAGQLASFSLDGAVEWIGPCGVVGNPSLADMDQDGRVEVIGGDAVLDGSTGALVGDGGVLNTTLNGWAPDAVAMDVDDDGYMELVTAEAVFSSGGEAMWRSTSGDGFVALADFAGDGLGIAVAGQPVRAWSEGTADPVTSVRLQDAGGATTWLRPFDGSYSGRPAIADVNADGVPDVLVGSDRLLWALSGQDGTVLWAHELPGYTFLGAPALSDLDGDGRTEVVVGGTRGAEVLCLATGDRLSWLGGEREATPWAWVTPVVADVDEDARLDVMLASHYGTSARIDVWTADGWQSGPSWWHQAAFWSGSVTGTGGVGGPAEQAAWDGGSFLATSMPSGGGGSAVSRDPTDRSLPPWSDAATIATLNFTLVAVEPGTYRMGPVADEPGAPDPASVDEALYLGVQHEVRLTHRLAVSTTEVTQTQFATLMGYNPARFTGCGGACPVETVSWSEAAAFANAASASEGFDACYTCSGEGDSVACEPASANPYDCPGYRLPSDAEWEYVARADTEAGYFSGGEWPEVSDPCTPNLPLTDGSLLDDFAWYCAAGDLGTHAVAQLAPNPWGLFDVLGNVSEWTGDWVDEAQTVEVVDPVNVRRGADAKILRGGSWTSPGFDLRSAARRIYPPATRQAFIGFRVVRTLNV